MFDDVFHQGSSLHELTQGPQDKVILLVHHAAAAAEMAVLWQTCRALVQQGARPLVLDGTVAEAPGSPGLLGILDGRDSEVDTSPIQVLPAALGIARLCNAGISKLTPLRQLTQAVNAAQDVRHERVWLIYASAAQLSHLSGGKPCEAVVALSATPQGMVESYQTIKQLIQGSRLMPMALVLGQTLDPPGAAQVVARRLQECVSTHLGRTLRANALETDVDGTCLSEQTHHIVLRMLENALTMSSREYPLTADPSLPATLSASWSH